MTKYNSRYAYAPDHAEQGGWRTYYSAPRAANDREGGEPAWLLFGPRHDEEAMALAYIKYIDEMQPRDNDNR